MKICKVCLIEKPLEMFNNSGKYKMSKCKVCLKGELNYGWDIDHIIPVSTASTEEEILKLAIYNHSVVK